tara:strand:- start:5115 stop:5729 length:615 start_codon:yes stop_codon:yes gene_type:complete
MNHAFDTHNVPRVSEEDIRRVIGLPLLTAITTLTPDTPGKLIEDIKCAFGDMWNHIRETEGINEPLFPGLPLILNQLEEDGWLLGIATGKSLNGLRVTLEKHNILERFVTLQTSDRARGKPNPEMLERAMREVGVNSTETIMIGDTTFDMEMARNADVTPVGVSWGYHNSQELRESGAYTVIDSYSELPDVLTEWILSRSTNIG